MLQSNRNTVIVKIPKKIRNTFAGFSEFQRISNQVYDLKGKKIIFDFSDTVWFDANLCSILGAIFLNMFEQGNEIHIWNLRVNIKTIFQKNGFLEYFDLDPEQDIYGTTVKFKVFDQMENTGFQSYLNKELFPKLNGKLDIDEEYKNYLSSILDEVYQNARIHGQTKRIIVCGQWFPNERVLKFTVTNLGKTIYENVVCKQYDIINQAEAIDWATMKGNTTREDGSGGLGLYQLKEFISINKGRMHIVSGNGYWGLSNAIDNQKREFDYELKGTIVNLEIRLDDIHHYELEENKLEYDKSILDIFI